MAEKAGVLEAALGEGALQLGIGIGPGEMSAFRAHYDMLIEENEKYNLTGITDEREAAVKHFLDSLSCLRVMGTDSGLVVDVGTGAGFPGVPLKVCRPGITLLLVDSVKKKAEFASALVKRLGLEGAGARWDRAEAMGVSGDFREKAEVVVSRAVSALNILAELCLPLVRVGGCFLAMKGPGWQEELKEAEKAIGVMGGRVERVENIVLPLVPEDRCLVLVRKESPTPGKYPRRPGIPAKRPIV